MRRRVVVTGVGPVSPIGVGRDDFLQGLRGGQMGVRKIETFDASDFRSRVAGEIPGFSCRDYVPKSYRKATKLMSRLCLLRRTKCWSTMTLLIKPNPREVTMLSASMVSKARSSSTFLFSSPVIMISLITAAPALVPPITPPAL